MTESNTLFNYKYDDRFSFAENLNRKMRYYALLISTLLLLVLAIITLILRSIAGETFSQLIIIMVSISILLITAYLLVVSNKIRFSSLTINAFLLIFIPLRTLEMGGLNSIVIYLFTIHVILAYVVLDNRLYAHLITAFCISFISVILIIAYFRNEEFDLLFRGVSLICIIFIIAIIINLVLNMKEQMTTEIKDNELHKSEKVILERISFEVYQSLSVISHHLEKIKSDNKENVDKAHDLIQLEVDSIKSITENLTELHNNNELTERLRNTNLNIELRKHND